MTNPVLALLALSLLAAPAATLLAHNVFVVSDPRQIQFVDLRDAHLAINERLNARSDILTPVRNTAMRRSIKGWGITRPSQGTVRIGSVGRVEDNGQLSFAVVLKGDVDAALVTSRLAEKYKRHWKRNGRTPAVQDYTQGEWKGIRMPYIERKGEFTALYKGNVVFLASTPPGNARLVDEMIEVLDGGASAEAPKRVQLRYRGVMTKRERTEVAEFVGRTLKGKLRQARRGFHKLYERIGGDVDEDEFKTSNEKLNELFLKMVGFELTLVYEQGPSGEDLYQVTYDVEMPDEESAQSMKELLLEKALFYRQNNPQQAIETTLDSVSIDRRGATLTIVGEVDSKEKQYDFAYAYTAFLMSYIQADKFIGLMPW